MATDTALPGGGTDSDALLAWVPWLAAGASLATVPLLGLPLGMGVLQSATAFGLAWGAARLNRPLLPELQLGSAPIRTRESVATRRRIADSRFPFHIGTGDDEPVAHHPNLRAIPPATPEPALPAQVVDLLGALVVRQQARAWSLRGEMRLLANARRVIRRVARMLGREIAGDPNVREDTDAAIVDLLAIEATGGLRERELREMRHELDAIRREAHRQHTRVTRAWTAGASRTLEAARRALQGWLDDQVETTVEHLARRERDVVRQLLDQRELVRRLNELQALLADTDVSETAPVDVIEDLFQRLNAIEREPEHPDEPIVLTDATATAGRVLRLLSPAEPAA